MAQRITTEELQKLEFWPGILECLNEAAAALKAAHPGTKVDLVRKKYVFWLVVDGVPEMEIDCYDLQQTFSKP